jgi:LemA protein
MQQRQQETESVEAQHPGYSTEEYREIVRRAQHLRAEKEGRVSQDVLVESAAEVGIREEDLKEAERQLREEKVQQKKQRSLRQAIAAGVAGTLALFMLFSYNSLNSSRLAAAEARGNVQAVLQRRADLAQQVVPVVRAGAQQERALQEAVASLRESLQTGSTGAQSRAAADLNRVLTPIIIARAESSPEFRSSELYRELQVQFEGSENRVAEYRRRYNRAATDYNRAAQSFPTNLVRPLFGFPREIPPFEAAAGAQGVPSFAP